MFVVFVLFAVCWAAAEPDRPGGGAGLQAGPGDTGVAVHGQLLYGVLQQLPQRRRLRRPEPQLQEGVQEDRPDHLQVSLLRRCAEGGGGGWRPFLTFVTRKVY